ncbi:MAG: hypothetical protein EOP13_23390 [Pseudomonas sp.]|uniref:hypothetical protein n=1 Tax=Pseudomonas sp. TaxID=306 RepID=UPI001216D67D|nr:hypothetical protein [Pseudomonas sp.]RZI69067.1 MAG: hypothetical protein EOP13_23390 [Pseudomonas sp.]
MNSSVRKRPSKLAAVVFDLLDPIAFGCFVGALIFDIAYATNADILWMKAAAWLIVIGLIVAIVPRFINLAWVWKPIAGAAPSGGKAAFWLHLLGIVAAIVNAFVHSRDAYAVIPEGLWLSIVTVGLFVIGHVVVTLQSFDHLERV